MNDSNGSAINGASVWTNWLFSQFVPRSNPSHETSAAYWGMLDVFHQKVSIPLFEQRLSYQCENSPEKCLHCIEFLASLIRKSYAEPFNRRFYSSFRILIEAILSLISVIFYRLSSSLFQRQRIAIFFGSISNKESIEDFRYSEISKNFHKLFACLRLVRTQNLRNSFGNLFRNPYISISIVFSNRKRIGLFAEDWITTSHIPPLIIQLFESIYRRPSTKLLSALIRLSGIRGVFILYFSSRTYFLFPIFKKLNILSVGMQHAAGLPQYNVNEFLRNPYTLVHIGPDIFGAWTSWWEQELKKTQGLYGRVQVSGPMRPLAKSGFRAEQLGNASSRFLWIDEQHADMPKVASYFTSLANKFPIDIKVRDLGNCFLLNYLRMSGFDNIVDSNLHIIDTPLNKIDPSNYTVIGSYSSAVLELAATGFKSIFIDTPKWGDYYNLRDLYPHVLVTKNMNSIENFFKKRVESSGADDIKSKFFYDKTSENLWAIRAFLNLPSD